MKRFILVLIFSLFAIGNDAVCMNDLGKRLDEIKRVASVCVSFATAAIQNGSAVYGGGAGVISFSIGSMAAEYYNLIDDIHQQKRQLQTRYSRESPYVKRRLNEEYKEICKYIKDPQVQMYFRAFNLYLNGSFSSQLFEPFL